MMCLAAVCRAGLRDCPTIAGLPFGHHAPAGSAQSVEAALSFEDARIASDYVLDNLVDCGEFKVVESTPIILKDSKEYDGSELSRFITQNPYSPQSLSNWENLHNSGSSNITVGVYGDIHDKDLESKIKVIKSLKEKLLDDSYVEDYSTYKDSYFYAISSDRKILRRYLSR